MDIRPVGAAKLHADRRTDMSEAMRDIRLALFWDITQPLVVILPTFRDNLSGPILKGQE